MSGHPAPRYDRPAAGLLSGIYLPRTADALVLAMSTYGLPLLVLATTGSGALTGLAFALEWVPRLAAFGWAGALVDRHGAAAVFCLASLGRALALAAGALALFLHPAGAGARVAVMILAAVTGALTEFSYIAAETAGAAAGRRAGPRAHRIQAAGPVIVVDHYGRSTTAVGLLWSAAAAATLLAVAVCRFAIDRLGLWPGGATCAGLAALACLAAAQASDYLIYLVLVAVLMAADGGLSVVLRTLRSRLIPPAQFGSTLAASILILLLPFPVAGVLTALTPPAALGHVFTACAALQALGLFLAFARLRTDPALRT
ncbi:MFS transporter [Streptomyces sp. NPDC057654]|uniref:MFS transporter n=1 Tax=Streptomyces sp. NPDC057654 TaxID=3346196 RepID=UPI00367A8870